MDKLLRVGLLFVMLATFGVAGAQDDEPLQVAASYSILADVVQNVTGETVTVSTLMPVGADPHTFQPTPRDLATLANADVIFTNGAYFEEALLADIENVETPIVEASACVGILPMSGEHLHHDEEGDEHAHEDEHAEGEDHEHAEGEEHEGEHDDEHAEEQSDAVAAMCDAHAGELAHDHEEDEAHAEHMSGMGALYTLDCTGGHTDGGCDPHVWMDPHNVMHWTLLIRDTLTEMDPVNADVYATNAAAYIEDLETLTESFIIPAVESVPEGSRVLVTNHETLGYFAAQFDFEIVTTVIPGSATGTEPSAAAVAGIIDVVNAEDVPAIFGESTVSDAVANQIATETGASLFPLYSGSLSEVDGPAATYIDYMTYNVTTIVEALGGATS